MDENIKAATKDRFTMVVKELKNYEGSQGLVGIAHGTIEGGEPLFISKSNMPVVKIEKYTTNKDGDNIEIVLEGKNVPETIAFAVITNVEPQATVDAGRPVENPFLLGLAREYKNNYSDKDFTNEFCYALVHAKFVVPVISDELGPNSGKLEKGTKVGFPMLNVGEDKNKKILPTFTDWGAFSKWKAYFEKNKPAKILAMTFDDVSTIACNNCDGLVVNPFTEPVPVPPPFIENIKASEGYQNEKNVTKRTIEKDTRIEIGLPKETEQIKLSKEALIGVGKADPMIKEIYLFAKKEESSVNLLAVFDLDFAVTEEERKAIFDKAYAAMLPSVGREMKVEFAMKAPAFIKLCSNQEPFYKA